MLARLLFNFFTLPVLSPDRVIVLWNIVVANKDLYYVMLRRAR